MALPIAVQVYSVRDDAKADLYGTLKRIKEIGYDGVEFAGLYGNAPADVKKMCEEIGLVPISAHVPFGDMLKEPVEVLSQYKEIGCKYVAIPHVGAEYRPGIGDWDAVIESAKTIGKVAKDLGMTLLYHNHEFEFATIGGKYGLDVLYESVPADLLQTELDTCWVNIGGEDPADYVRKYAGRCPVVHLKDFFGERSEDMYELIGVERTAPKRPGNFEFRPVGYGMQDIPAITKAAEESGAFWLVVEQDRPSQGRTQMEAIACSREYLKSIGY